MLLGILLFVCLVSGFIVAGQGRRKVRKKYSRREAPWYYMMAHHQDSGHDDASQDFTSH